MDIGVNSEPAVAHPTHLCSTRILQSSANLEKRDLLYLGSAYSYLQGHLEMIKKTTFLVAPEHSQSVTIGLSRDQAAKAYSE